MKVGFASGELSLANHYIKGCVLGAARKTDSQCEWGNSKQRCNKIKYEPLCYQHHLWGSPSVQKEMRENTCGPRCSLCSPWQGAGGCRQATAGAGHHSLPCSKMLPVGLLAIRATTDIIVNDVCELPTILEFQANSAFPAAPSEKESSQHSAGLHAKHRALVTAWVCKSNLFGTLF